ncbi:MAG: helix-turn-helix domain-containing protein [Terriglobales bacterium]
MSISFNAATILASWPSLGIFPRRHEDQRLTRSQEGRRQTVSEVRERGNAIGKNRDTVKPRCLKTNDAAAYLGMSEWAIRQEVNKGELPFISSGEHTSSWKFDVKDLDAWVERHRVKF